MDPKEEFKETLKGAPDVVVCIVSQKGGPRNWMDLTEVPAIQLEKADAGMVKLVLVTSGGSAVGFAVTAQEGERIQKRWTDVRQWWAEVHDRRNLHG